MSDDPQFRRPTKRPKASKTLQLDSDNADLLMPQADNWSLTSLSTKLKKEKHDQEKMINYLQKQLSLLNRIRNQLYNDYHLLEKSRTPAQPEQVSRTHLVSYDALKRPAMTIISNNNLQKQTTNISTIKPQAAQIKPAHKRNANETNNPEAPKSMSSLTIWNNVNRFFVVAPTMEAFQAKLQASEAPDTKIQLGPHYSIGINQKLKQKYKNGNVQLRIPPEVMAESPEGATPIIFHRLLAALVNFNVSDLNALKKEAGQNNRQIDLSSNSSPVRGSDYINHSNLENPSNLGNLSNCENSSNFIASSNYGENPSLMENSTQFPVNVAGSSVYSMYPFEQKLMLEVQSLNLTPDASGPRLTDNEVMNDIVMKTEELSHITSETNKIKSHLLEMLKQKEKGLLERRENMKKWGTVSFKLEPGPKKDQKRPKKRDKLV
ncbi:hypothetical protein TRFO_02432 [Tritrichomonas foetus]|uniref:Uncharacterized protein n=1 Tax=Tritrichomonas foetus TaxID=1144522 RepID=A0A1J4J9H4_9EUKA|nr:hypothetical protein TRFO_02432 [Tritrichomonas foetus]|eukprot:OHS93884.1 hypothetical protein TRFO_02432 [Tritrichomonas foetus]